MLKLCSKCGVEKPLEEFGTFLEKRGAEPKRYFNSYCKQCAREHTNKYNADNKERIATHRRNYSQKRLDIIYEHYGGKCVCCGESERMFLTIDHVNNDGNIERKKHSSNNAYYARIIAAGFPDTYQLLCWNCNCGRQRNGGVCPHQC